MKSFVLKTIPQYLLLFFLLLVFSNRSHAQKDAFTTPIIKGDRIQSNEKNKNFSPVGLDKAGGSYIVVFEGNAGKEVPYLVHVDSAMNKINAVELPWGFQAAVLLKNELYVVSALLKEPAKVTAYVQKFNKETLLPEEKEKMLCTMDYKQLDKFCISMNPVKSGTCCMVKVSRDETKIMISTNSNCQINEIRSVWVFDSTFNLLWNKETAQNSVENQVDQFDIDNNGNVFFTIRSKDPKRIRESGLDYRYAYYLLAFFDAGKDVKEIILSFTDKIVIHMDVLVDNNNNVICAGLFIRPNPNRISGTCFFKIDQSLKAITKVTYDDFDANLYLTKCTEEELQKVKQQAQGGKSFPYFGNFNVLLYGNQNGSIFLTAEVNSYGEEGTYYRQILTFKYSNDGQLIWSNKIPKYQQTTDIIEYFSFFATPVGEDFYIIYNDNTSNFNIKPCEVPDVFTLRNEFELVIIKIDSEGKAVKKYMLPNDKQDVWMRPTISNVFNKDQLILIGESRNDNSYKFFKTTLRY